MYAAPESVLVMCKEILGIMYSEATDEAPDLDEFAGESCHVCE